jgi:lipopolysaccharide export system permease protein
MIVSRYLIKEVISALISVLLILMVIALANQVVKLLAQVAAGRLSLEMFTRLITLYIPYLISYLLPFSLFLAILIGYGRLYAENEMAAFFSNGLSYIRFYLITLFQILLVMVIVAIMSLWLKPYADQSRNQLKYSSDQFSGLLDRLTPGYVQEIPNNRGIIYVKDIKNKQSTDVFIAIADSTQKTDTAQDAWNIIVANTGKVQSKSFENTKNHYYVLNHGHIFHQENNPNHQSYLSFKNYGLHLQEEKNEDISYNSLSTKKLWVLAHNKKDLLAKAELQWRISQPIATFMLGLLALTLCKINPRQGQFNRIIPGILLYIIYMNGILTLRTWMSTHRITSLYWIHGIALLVVILINIQQSGLLRKFNQSQKDSFDDH